MDKQLLRKHALLQRDQLPKNVFWQLNDELVKQLAQFNWSAIHVLHLFLPIVERKEVDTFEFVNFFKTNHPHINLVVPRCNFNTKEMEAIHFEPEVTVLAKNKQQIPEPIYGNIVDVKLIDAVIVPLLAFDQKGHRVGYGAGFYDRFLEQCKPDVLKIGVSLFEPVEEIIDTHQHDIPLTHCITPNKTYYF